MANDTIYGSSANENLNGADGNDVYIIEPGGGQDTINDLYAVYSPSYIWLNGGNDTIQFSEGITLNDCIFTGENNDLIIYFDGTTDSVRIINYLHTLAAVH